MRNVPLSPPCKKNSSVIAAVSGLALLLRVGDAIGNGGDCGVLEGL